MHTGFSGAPAPGTTEQGSEYAIAMVHFLVKEVEWIRMLSTRLCRRAREPERMAKDLECIRDLSGSVARRMRGYLDEARRAGDASADQTGVGALLDEAVRQVARRYAGARISARIDEDVRGVTVPSQLLVAVVAVLENAIDFSRDEDEVSVRARSEGDELVISIEDSGIGMDAAVLSACQARGFTTRLGNGGQGLGLYSASRILVRSRGDLLIESEPGSGTLVLLRIPVR